MKFVSKRILVWFIFYLFPSNGCAALTSIKLSSKIPKLEMKIEVRQLQLYPWKRNLYKLFLDFTQSEFRHFETRSSVLSPWLCLSYEIWLSSHWTFPLSQGHAAKSNVNTNTSGEIFRVYFRSTMLYNQSTVAAGKRRLNSSSSFSPLFQTNV